MAQYKKQGGKLYANVNGTTWLEEGRCLEPGVWGEIREEDRAYIEHQEFGREWRAAWTSPAGLSGNPTNSTPVRGSDHYTYPDPDKRRAIVSHYRRDKAMGSVANKDAWAQVNYMISGRTLLNYEREFPEEP